MGVQVLTIRSQLRWRIPSSMCLSWPPLPRNTSKNTWKPDRSSKVHGPRSGGVTVANPNDSNQKIKGVPPKKARGSWSMGL